jgi:hypothetical protein
MGRNLRNTIKFTIAAIATFVFAYFIGQDLTIWYNLVGVIIPILIFIGYGYHVFTDKTEEEKELEKIKNGENKH